MEKFLPPRSGTLFIDIAKRGMCFTAPQEPPVNDRDRVTIFYKSNLLRCFIISTKIFLKFGKEYQFDLLVPPFGESLEELLLIFSVAFFSRLLIMRIS
jgi:hypothetical protein